MSKSRIKSEILRNAPALSYDIVEHNLRNLQGQVLTILEAVLPKGSQLDATKDLVKDKFNNKLTWFFDLYGDSTKKETPSYADVKSDGTL